MTTSEGRRTGHGGRAEVAWWAKDWPGAVAAYARYENGLTESERRRPDLARRRTAGAGS